MENSTKRFYSTPCLAKFLRNWLLVSCIRSTAYARESNEHNANIFVQDLLTSGNGAVYFDPKTNSYTSIVELPSVKSVYVVADGNTLLRLSMNNLRYMTSFKLPSIPTSPICVGSPEVPCDEQAAFNLLAKTNDGQTLWYCYVYQTKYMKNTIIPNVDSARCEIPHALTLEPNARLVQWENSVFSSLDLGEPGVHLLASDNFLYTTGWFDGTPRIHRVRLPNFDGMLNWDKFLTIPASGKYIRQPAAFLLTFETDEAVYFLIYESTPTPCDIEMLNHQGDAYSEFGATLMQPSMTNVTRLIRICKGDPGGYPHVNEDEFSTFSKATVLCRIGEGKGVEDGQFHHLMFEFNHAVAATWDPIARILVVSFTNTGSPSRAAICIYSVNDIEKAFNSQLITDSKPTPSLTGNTIPNIFPNICSKFSSGSVTNEELERGRHLFRDHLLHKESIQPMGGSPFLINNNTSGDHRGMWTHLLIDNIGPTIILYAATKKYVDRYHISWDKDESELRDCHIDRFTIGLDGSVNEQVTALGALETHPATYFYILTTKHVIRLPTSVYGCDHHKAANECSLEKTPYCVWNEESHQCQTRKSGIIDKFAGLPTLLKCSEKVTADASALKWKEIITASNSETNDVHQSVLPCFLTTAYSNSNHNLSCQCGPCSNCANTGGLTLEVHDCTLSPNWSPWSLWSACSSQCGSGIRSQTRYCDSPGSLEVETGGESTVHGSTCKSINERGRTKYVQREVHLETCQSGTVCEAENSSGQPSHEVRSQLDTTFILQWSEWTPCSAQCGSGVQNRTRICRSSISGHQDCNILSPADHENRLCHNFICTGRVSSTSWTEWVHTIPPRSNTSVMETKEARSRVRFECTVISSTGSDMEIARVQYAERKCTSFSRSCTPILMIDKSKEWARAQGTRDLKQSGHWSTWGSWSPCHLKCILPSNVVQSSERQQHIAKVHDKPLYAHGGVQVRQRNCLFTTVDNCPGGLEKATEVKGCPPNPACHTGWSCWSDWSSCVGLNMGNNVRHPVCHWSTDGWRKRSRKCVMSGEIWGSKVNKNCVGSSEYAEKCPYFSGDPAGCSFTESHVDWSEWAEWTKCGSDNQPTRELELKKDATPEGQPQILHVLRKRVRKCVSIGKFDAIEAEPPIVVGKCSGPWQQQQTCPREVLRLAAVSPNVHTVRRFGIIQLIIIGSIAFTICLSLCALVITIYHCTRREPRKNLISGNGYMRTGNYTPVRPGPRFFDQIPPTFVVPHISNPPIDPTQVVYDSVASQDVPSIFGIMENEQLDHRNLMDQSNQLRVVRPTPVKKSIETDDDLNQILRSSRGISLSRPDSNMGDYGKMDLLGRQQTTLVQNNQDSLEHMGPDYPHRSIRDLQANDPDYDNQLGHDIRALYESNTSSTRLSHHFHHSPQNVSIKSSFNDILHRPVQTSSSTPTMQVLPIPYAGSTDLSYLDAVGRQPLMDDDPDRYGWNQSESRNEFIGMNIQRPGNPHLRDSIG